MSLARPDREELLNFFRILPNTQFVIPVYQRNYIWTAKKQLKKYLEDYHALLRQEKEKHFIGIIMYLQRSRKIGFNECSIVDGQQRLVTTFLILYALKKIAEETKNENLANTINTQYLTNQFVDDDSDRLKLKPLVSDDHVFEKIVKDDLSSLSKEDKKTNVYLNYMEIKKFLKGLYGHYSLDKMLNTLDKFYFVAIPLDSQEDDAQKIFETINSAGAALSKADLIRNYILMNMSNNDQEKLYKDYWYPLERSFYPSGKIENFFRMFLANQNYTLDNMEDIYDVFQIWYDNYKKEYGVEASLKTICEYAKYYNDIFVNEDAEISPEVDKVLSEFRKNAIEPTAPLLMEVYHLYKKSDELRAHFVSASNFAKIISLFNTYNVRRNICNQRTGILTRIVPLMLKYVIDKCDGVYDNIYKHCVSYLVDNSKGKQSFMPDDEYLKLNLAGANAYSLRNYVKTIFEKIESHDNPAVVDFSNLSIEHLMPQTPTDDWLKAVNLTKEEYEYHLHRLGNLTLATVPDNSKMSNNPFEYKKEILESTSHLKMNQEIIAEEKWGADEIDKRTTAIIEKICKLYPYVSVGEQEINYYNIFLHSEDAEIYAHIFTDGTIEVQERSYFKTQYNNAIKTLVEEEVVKESGNKYEFITSYSLANLDEATNLFAPSESLDSWELWVDKNDQPLNVDIRTKLNNKK